MSSYIGWVTVAWLFGSTIYATKFHSRNYCNSKNREIPVSKELDFAGEIVFMSKKSFLREVISIQLIKIAVMLFLVYWLL